MPTSKPSAISQAEIEQATGLTREVLRKWELRYQFPTPVRGDRGRRVYSPDDVQRLQLIKRLLHQGLRPGKLMHLPLDDLQALLTQTPLLSANAMDASQVEASTQAMLTCIAPGASPLAMRIYLEGLVKEDGLAHFVEHHLPVFNRAVGDAWAAGQLGIHAEHHYTETIRNVVLCGLSRLPLSHVQPRVLLTTPPGELHGLGMLALQTALMLQGADCISLGTQTPVPDVVRAVRDLDVGVVAISVSVCLPLQTMLTYVEDLRQHLPTYCTLWVGGLGCAALGDTTSAGLVVFQSTRQALQAWQELSHQAKLIEPEACGTS